MRVCVCVYKFPKSHQVYIDDISDFTKSMEFHLAEFQHGALTVINNAFKDSNKDSIKQIIVMQKPRTSLFAKQDILAKQLKLVPFANELTVHTLSAEAAAMLSVEQVQRNGGVHCVIKELTQSPVKHGTGDNRSDYSRQVGG